MVLNNTKEQIASPYVELSSSAKSNIGFAEEQQVALLQDYFSKLDGSPQALDNIQPLLPEMFHPDFRMILSSSDSDRQELDYNKFIEAVTNFCHSGCISTLDSVESNPKEGTITVVVKNTFPGEQGEATKQTVYYQDGKIIRVEAIPGADADTFHTQMNRVVNISAANIDEDKILLDLFRAYIGAFDGSPDALARAKPTMEILFDTDVFRIRTGKDDVEEKDYREWVDVFLTNYSEERSYARIEELERTDYGLRTVIHNTVKGKDVGSTEQRVFVKNGKIVYWESAPSNENEFKAMIDRVLSKDPDDELIEKFRTFMDAFDGSPDAFDKARPIMDEIFEPKVFRIRTDTDGPAHDYDWFLDFVAKYATGGSVARIEELEKTETGLRTVIHNTVKGKDMGTTEERGIIENGKIVYWEAAPGDEKRDEFKAMVDRVMSEK